MNEMKIKERKKKEKKMEEISIHLYKKMKNIENKPPALIEIKQGARVKMETAN